MTPLPEGFAWFRRPGGRLWILRRGFPEYLVASESDAWLAGRGGRPLTGQGGRSPARLVAAEGVGEVVVRRYFHGGLLAPLTRDLFWGTRRPIRELVSSEAVRGRGVSTPEILAVCLRRAVGGLYRGCVLTRRIPEGENLREWLGRREWNRETWRSLVPQVARTVAALHQAGCIHGDLNLSNLVLSASGISILDLDGSRMEHCLGVADRGGNLLRLYRSLRKETDLGEPLPRNERQLFLRHYARGDRQLYRTLATWLDRRWALSRARRPSRRPRALRG